MPDVKTSDLIELMRKRMPELGKENMICATNLIQLYISKAIADGEEVTIRDFGSFHAKEKPAVTKFTYGRYVQIDAKRRPHFRPGNGLSEAVDRGFKNGN